MLQAKWQPICFGLNMSTLLILELHTRLPSFAEFQYFVGEIALLLLKLSSNFDQNTENCHNFAIVFAQRYWNLCKNEQKYWNSYNLLLKWLQMSFQGFAALCTFVRGEYVFVKSWFDNSWFWITTCWSEKFSKWLTTSHNCQHFLNVFSFSKAIWWIAHCQNSKSLLYICAAIQLLVDSNHKPICFKFCSINMFIWENNRTTVLVQWRPFIARFIIANIL